jgi:hypothetical protein
MSSVFVTVEILGDGEELPDGSMKFPTAVSYSQGLDIPLVVLILESAVESLTQHATGQPA